MSWVTIDATAIRSFIGRYLDPDDILGEVLFGLIMTLGFTLGAGLIVKEGKDAVTQMLLGVVGCNVAWGLVDAAMYIIGSMFDRSRKARLLESIQKSATDDDALLIVGQELDPSLEPFTTQTDRRHLYQAVLTRLRNIAPERTHLNKADIYGAIATFGLVFLSTIPAVVPFLIITDRFMALRVSDLLLLSVLFLVGYHLGRALHTNPWILGSVVFLVGLVLVAIVIVLGG
jgi:VIT1/CCC1 family predicted Fe2+/Mn2+ transporter